MENVNWERLWRGSGAPRPQATTLQARNATREHHGNLLLADPPNVTRPSRRLAVPAGALVLIGAFA